MVHDAIAYAPYIRQFINQTYTAYKLESKASALDVFWSSTLQLWTFFGVQRFSFGRFFSLSQTLFRKD
ncbi:MAG: hypothetical protein KAI83_19500 [Thiomargarita sp.]|nr:hypothetical protein [Thiomargarita sp.]